jgi:ATP-dependent DNA helicase RecG
VLLTADLNPTAEERIHTMVRTQDGFEIAETDLRLRGPGEFFGTKQSGLPAFRVANLVRDREALEAARSEATAYIENPPSPGELKTLVDYIRQKWQRRYGLVQVG